MSRCFYHRHQTRDCFETTHHFTPSASPHCFFNETQNWHILGPPIVVQNFLPEKQVGDRFRRRYKIALQQYTKEATEFRVTKCRGYYASRILQHVGAPC